MKEITLDRRDFLDKLAYERILKDFGLSKDVTAFAVLIHGETNTVILNK